MYYAPWSGRSAASNISYAALVLVLVQRAMECQNPPIHRSRSCRFVAPIAPIWSSTPHSRTLEHQTNPARPTQAGEFRPAQTTAKKRIARTKLRGTCPPRDPPAAAAATARRCRDELHFTACGGVRPPVGGWRARGRGEINYPVPAH